MASLIRAVQAAAITTGGPTQDFPTGGHADFSASEPVKAALVFFAPSTTNGTALDHARLSFGFTDGTRHRCISIRGRDAQTTKSNVRNSFNDVVASIYAANATTAAGVLAHSAFTSSNRFTGSWSTLPPAAWRINTVLIGGSDCQAYVGEAQGSASENGTVDVNTTTDSSFTFDWNVLFFISRGVNAFDGTSANNTICSIGVAIWDGTTIKQGCVSFSSENTALAATAVGCCVEDDVVQRTHLTGGPTLGDGLELTARASSAGHRFTLTKRGANGTQPRVAFLALNLPGLQGLDLRARGTRTSNGTDDWTEPGHAPQAVFGLYSRTQTLNTIATDGDGASFGCGIMTERNDTTIDEFCSAYMDADNVTTTDTKAETNNVGHEVPSGTGAAGTLFDLTSFDTQGANFNYTATLAAARQMLLLSIGRPVIPINARSVTSAEAGAALTRDAGLTPRSETSSIAGVTVSRDRNLAAAALAGSIESLIVSRARNVTPQTVAEGVASSAVTRNRALEARSGDVAHANLAATAARYVESRSTSGAVDRLGASVDRWLTGSFLGEGFNSLPLTVVAENVILLACAALGESVSQLSIFRTLGLSPALVAEATVQAVLSRDRFLDTRSVGGHVGSLPLTRASSLAATALGQHEGRLAVGADRFMVAQTVGDGVTLGTLGTVRFLSASLLSEVNNRAAIDRVRSLAAAAAGQADARSVLDRVRSLSASTSSEAVSLFELSFLNGVSVFLTCQTLSEALLAAALSPIRSLAITTIGASDTRTAIGTARSLNLAAVSDGVAGLSLTRQTQLAGASSVSSGITQLDLTRGRTFGATGIGESVAQAALIRERLLSVVSASPADVKTRLDVVRGLTGVSTSPAITQLGLALEHFLQARTVAEQQARVSVFFAILNRYALQLTVPRTSQIIVVSRVPEQVRVQRSSVSFTIPSQEESS